jgi:hypothetical protein
MPQRGVTAQLSALETLGENGVQIDAHDGTHVRRQPYDGRRHT